MPNSPNVPARTIRAKRMSRTAEAIFIDGMTKLAIAVKDTTITIAPDTKPACTAACPKTRAPTIEMAGPMTRGIRTPASRMTSKISSIAKASYKAGRGAPSRCPAKVIRSVVGIISC
ncbi:hypothetical protein D3C81_1326700 [compost metagenome]